MNYYKKIQNSSDIDIGVISLIVVFIITVIGAVLIISSYDTSNDENVSAESKNDKIMKKVEDEFYYNIYVDTETNVMYFIYDDEVCIMVNSDGTPKLWKGEE